MAEYLFPSYYSPPALVLLCSVVLQHYKQIVIVLIKFCPGHTWAAGLGGWVAVGGDR